MGEGVDDVCRARGGRIGGRRGAQRRGAVHFSASGGDGRARVCRLGRSSSRDGDPRAMMGRERETMTVGGSEGARCVATIRSCSHADPSAAPLFLFPPRPSSRRTPARGDLSATPPDQRQHTRTAGGSAAVNKELRKHRSSVPAQPPAPFVWLLLCVRAPSLSPPPPCRSSSRTSVPWPHLPIRTWRCTSRRRKWCRYTFR